VTLLEPIRSALEQGDLELAQQALLDSLYSSEAIDFWNGVVRLPSADSIHHTLSFVSGLRFDPDEETAHIDLETRVLVFGTRFFLETIQGFGDLLFVLLHERGHILISLVYGTQMAAFKNRKFGNLWEDVYINNTILFLMNSDLCFRVYHDSDKFFRSLLSQEFTRWVAEHHEWLRFHLPPKWLYLVRDVALKTPFFTQKITYSEWMEIGLLVEQGLLKDKERRDVLDAVGSGDLLGDMAGDDEAPASPVRSPTTSSPPKESEDDAEPTLGVARNDVDGDPVPGYRVDPPRELPEALKQVLHSFAAHECPPEFEPLFREMNLKMEIENTIIADLVGDVLSRKQGDEVYQGKSASFQGLHRRDMFLVAAGYDLTLWTVDLPVTKQKLKLYIDVSGSMWSFLHVIMLIHRHLKEFVDEHLQFSDVVVSVDPDENYIYGTGGTCYMAVAEHMISSGCTEAIVLTDNTDSLSAAMISKLKNQLQYLYLIQTQEPGKKKGFNVLATKTITIPTLGD
jgi:hypothetical protein